MSVSPFAPRPQKNIEFWEERTDLACAFRWAARLDMHEAVANHFSLAVSDDGTKFLVNPNGRHFSRVTASELLLVDANNSEAMNRPGAPDPTAYALHGGIHRTVPGARCLLHVHSKYATALACLTDSLLPPIDQNTMRFYGRMAVDDGFDGMGLGDEADRVAKTVSLDKPILVMGNHGVMVIGETVAKAFDELYYFERACETYITALHTGKELRVVSDAIARKTCLQWLDYPNLPENHFRALKEILDQEEPGYRD